MAYTDRLSQKIRVRILTTDEIAEQIVNDCNALNDYSADEWELSDVPNEHIIDITIYGNCKVYPSHSYYDPDEYEYDEQFLFDGDEDIVKETFFPKGVEVVSVNIGEIDY